MFFTAHAYNSLNQVVEQESPDGGLSRFWYDRLGRLVVSQNAEQYSPIVGNNSNRFSYTLYDDLGRIIEVGEKISGEHDLSLVDTRNPEELDQWMNDGTKRQITQTIYDNPDPLVTWDGNIILEQIRNYNSRKRVVTSIYREVEDAPEEYNFATHYVYDISGNVKKLYQENRKLYDNTMIEITKTMDYEFDLVSGKVNRVWYQKGMQDQYVYDYVYDADNKLLEALSGRDETTLRFDARYYYHLHGPLARTELAHDPVQGVDYAYTLQGWLKGINGVFLNELYSQDPYDLGYDGVRGGSRETIPGDVYAYSLGYFNNDYTPVDDRGGDHPFIALPFDYNANGNPYTGYELFNGNIAYTSFASSMLLGRNTMGYSYRYDQLNRLVGMRSHEPFKAGGTWGYNTTNDDYAEEVSYDPNGNIQSYNRNGPSSINTDMDQLTYHYKDPLNNNLLDRVHDVVNAGNYSEDLDSQSEDNYQYDNIGNLIVDNKEEIISIEWTVYGKIRRIRKEDGSEIHYDYDPSGNRISKRVVDSNQETMLTYYFRDAQGNVMGVYSKENNSPIYWNEQHLYGSSRLGMLAANEEITNEVPDPYDETVIGSRRYELTNHLGNVLTVVTDMKWYNGEYWEADVINVRDYYPGGMQMPGRTYSLADGYRYGFNGQEKSLELDTDENSYSAEYWQYDARISRRWNLDPKCVKGLSPFATFQNNPIAYTDMKGDTARFDVVRRTSNQQTQIFQYKYYDGQLRDENDNIVNDLSTIDATLNQRTLRIVGEFNAIRGESEFGKFLIDHVTGHERETRYSTTFNRTITGSNYILFNFDQRDLIPTTDGVEPVSRNFRATIVHEFAHLFNHLEGSRNEKVWAELPIDNLGNNVVIRYEEVVAMSAENMYRTQVGLPIRTHYAVYDNERPVNDTEIGGTPDSHIHYNSNLLMNLYSLFKNPLR